jgi:hypothetical protein
MNDPDREIREMLERRARNVQPRGDVPPGLRGRVRRRIALNSIGVAAVVVVMGVAGFAGIRALTGTSKVAPIAPGTPVATTPPTSTGPATPSACTSDQLSVSADLGGAAGSLVGPIELKNTSSDTCTLQGPATIRLLDASGQPITSGVRFVSTQAQWQADNDPRPEGWPAVTLRPQGFASVRLSWSNWCPTALPTWQVEIPGSGVVDFAPKDLVSGADTSPPCNGPGQPSLVQIGPFEPGWQLSSHGA